MSIKITTLIEDKLNKNSTLISEHGLSFLIECDNKKVLFDTGQSDNFIANAKKLNIDLYDVDYVVISHSHYDHANGFKSFCDISKKNFSLYISHKFFDKKYSKKCENFIYKGSNFDKQFLIDRKINTFFIDRDITNLTPKINIISNIKRTTYYEKINSNFYVNIVNSYVKDCFDDEIILTIDTPKGLIVLVGCSHVGIINILKTIEERLHAKIYGIIGGTHLIEADENRIDLTLNEFRKMDLKFIGISHCTGTKALEKLEKDFSNIYFNNNTGNIITI